MARDSGTTIEAAADPASQVGILTHFIQGLKQVVANDISEDAVKAIERNVAYNEIDSKSVTSNLGDATDVMYGSRSPDRRFDVVDLDPYGGAAVFLDGAVQCVKNGGLLAVTCTDMAVLCGSYPEARTARIGACHVLHTVISPRRSSTPSTAVRA